jgi:hypothetical protein
VKKGPFIKSWKTSVVAILVFVIALCRSLVAIVEGDAVDVDMLVEAFVAAAIGVGFWLSRDSDKSSQDVGIRPEDR